MSLRARATIAPSPGEIHGADSSTGRGACVQRATIISPFDATQPLDKILIAVLRGARPSLRARREDLPPAIDAWVEQALAIKPDDRFQTPRSLWSAFLSVMRVELGR